MKKVLAVTSAPERQWVGDGFPVQTLFDYGAGARQRSPFLYLDYVAPQDFPPNTQQRRGVDPHPHRGFETVTILYEGELEHRDSYGGGGVVGPGDVQWMTAGAGLLHEEFHSVAYSARGGTLYMVQLWINLPARHKLTPPRYQPISHRDIPQVKLADGAGSVRVIAGEFAQYVGPAATFTPMNVWEVRLAAGQALTLDQPDGWTTLLLIQQGAVRVNASESAQAAELVSFSHEGSGVHIEASADAHLLLLAGEPIDEPVVGYGPFVMNSAEEIKECVAAFRSGQFGQLDSVR